MYYKKPHNATPFEPSQYFSLRLWHLAFKLQRCYTNDFIETQIYNRYKIYIIIIHKKSQAGDS